MRFIGGCCCLFAFHAFASDASDLSLEELLNTPVEVTKQKSTARESANVVLTVTRDEILASGARDLLEVLQLVPGFTFHTDVQGTVGIAFRGLWAHEGKLLLMLDGQEMNELLYSTTQFGHHILSGSIERVEVIRGPGSALYGGFAELAVVNVITRQGQALNGTALTSRVGVGEKGLHDWSVAATAGGRNDANDFEWSIHGAGGQAVRTRRDFVDFSGNSVNLGNDPLNPLLVNAVFQWKGLRARFIYDDYTQGATPAFGTATAGGITRFRSTIGDVSYEFKPIEKLSFKARINLRHQLPWQTTDVSSEFFYDKSVTRLLGAVSTRWQAHEMFALSGGLEGFWDQAWLNNTNITGAQTLFGDSHRVSYGNAALWLQGEVTTPYLNVTAGGRLEYHSAIGVNFAPRIALTKQWDWFHAKLLYGGAFRSPGIENLNLAPAGTLKAEHTHVVEAEVGASVSDLAFFSVNGFYTLIALPIIYGVAPGGAESYFNGGAIATAGLEALARVRGSRGHVNFSYSLALPVAAKNVDTWVTPGRGIGVPLLGMPAHKLTLSGKVIIHRHFSAGGSAIFMSGRYGFLSASDALDGTGVIGRVNDSLLLSAWLGADHVGLEGLSFQLGVGNILNSNVPFVQPYDGGMAPIPGRGREYFLRASLELENVK
jgi:outer membrane cobalamin receptor